MTNQPKEGAWQEAADTSDGGRDAPGQAPGDGPGSQKGSPSPRIDPDQSEKELKARIDKLIDRKQRNGEI